MASGTKYQPALLGGLFIGILSSLPLISGLNACCCLWVVVGGVLTTYLRQQQEPEPLETSDALLSGLIAGAIGAVLDIIGNYVFMQLTGPLWQDQVLSQLDANPDLPPQMREWMMKVLSGQGLALLQVVVVLPMFAIFGMLGSLLGLTFFRRKPSA